MSAATVLKSMEKEIGKEMFVSDWTQVTQDQINKFADSTKDFQWIHVDEEKAANPFLRADVPAVAASVGLAGKPAAQVFAEVRARKNRF